MGKSAMRSSWTYKLGENIIWIVKEYKDLGVVIQDNLSSEKHINRIFSDTFMMLRNIWMGFHFLDKDMIKLITIMIRPKLEYAEVIWSPHKKKHVLKLERIQRIATKMVPDWKTYNMRNIKNEKTARSQLMTYTRQLLALHPWNNPMFSHPTCHSYLYFHPNVF